MDGLDYALVDRLTDEWAEAVQAELREFNRTQNPEFWAALEAPRGAARG
jgi:hypothetical protein